MNFFVSVAKGCESVLREELAELGLKHLHEISGGVGFAGTLEDAWRVCLWSRTAQRVLLPLAEFKAPDPDALYAGAVGVEWGRYLTPALTFAVSAASRSSAITHTDFAALKVKDAIADRLRKDCGERSSVSRDDPDLHVFVRLFRDKATIYLDMAGTPLQRRGYRVAAREAPLKETLAAAMLRLSGWNKSVPLLDPMCGSGSIPIEAALWAKGVAPGIFRPRFGFERWADFNDEGREAMARLRGEARRLAHGQPPRIVGSDVDPAATAAATANAKSAGVRISIREADLAALQSSGGPGYVITNPPYGHRLAAGVELYRLMASVFSKMHGWRICLLVGGPEIARSLPMRPVFRQPLYNGDIECEFLVYDVE